MRLFIDLKKAKSKKDSDEKAPSKDGGNPNKVRGAVRGGGYLKRVVTGTDKDGSPQYRYIRSQAELKAWEANQRKNKPKSKGKEKEKLKDKVSREHKESTDKTKPKEKDTKKSLYIKG